MNQRKIDLDKMVDMINAGATAEQMASTFACSVGAIYKASEQLKRDGRIPAQLGIRRCFIDSEKLIELKRAGMTDKAAAEVLGVSRSAVTQAKNDLIREGVDLTPINDAPAQKRIEEKPATKTVAESFTEEEDDKRMTTETIINAKDYIAEKHLQMDDQPASAPVRKFPRGVTPKELWLEDRRDDLRRAICEFACEGLHIDPAWVDEYNELLAQTI